MLKSQLKSLKIEKSQDVELENVVSVTFFNFKDEEVTITYDNVPHILPAAKPNVDGTIIPTGINVSTSNYPFDINFKVKFPVKNGNVVVDYLQLKNS